MSMHKYVYFSPCAVDSFDQERSGALQQRTCALVANTKRCHLLSVANRPCWRVDCSDCTQLMTWHLMAENIWLVNVLDNNSNIHFLISVPYKSSAR